MIDSITYRLGFFFFFLSIMLPCQAQTDCFPDDMGIDKMVPILVKKEKGRFRELEEFLDCIKTKLYNKNAEYQFLNKEYNKVKRLLDSLGNTVVTSDSLPQYLVQIYKAKIDSIQVALEKEKTENLRLVKAKESLQLDYNNLKKSHKELDEKYQDTLRGKQIIKESLALEQQKVKELNREKDSLNQKINVQTDSIAWLNRNLGDSTRALIRVRGILGNTQRELAWTQDSLTQREKTLDSLIRRLDRPYNLLAISYRFTPLIENPIRLGPEENRSLYRLLTNISLSYYGDMGFFLGPFNYYLPEGMEIPFIEQRNSLSALRNAYRIQKDLNPSLPSPQRIRSEGRVEWAAEGGVYIPIATSLYAKLGLAAWKSKMWDVYQAELNGELNSYIAPNEYAVDFINTDREVHFIMGLAWVSTSHAKGWGINIEGGHNFLYNEYFVNIGFNIAKLKKRPKARKHFDHKTQKIFETFFPEEKKVRP